MRHEIPDFSLLTGFAAGGATLRERSVIFHFPTHTILELAKSDDQLMKFITPRYDWEWINKYGEVSKFSFIVHRYVTDDLTDVFQKAKEWYKDLLYWMDTNDDASDDFLNVWSSPSNDLPN